MSERETHEAYEAQRDAAKGVAAARGAPSRHDEAMHRMLGAAFYGVQREQDRVTGKKKTRKPAPASAETTEQASGSEASPAG